MAAAQVTTKDFWASIAGHDRAPLDPKASIVIRGIPIGITGTIQQEMFSHCKMVDAFARKLFEKPPEYVIDLGCGSGANSLPLYRKGAKVKGIDSDIRQIWPYAAQTLPPESREGRLELVVADITKVASFGEEADAVLAVDILPYLQPSTLQATMEKIHSALKKGGLLIGTLFLDLTGDPRRELMEALGAHFYEGGAPFVTTFLQNAGFHPEEIEAREEGGYRFRATKLSA